MGAAMQICTSAKEMDRRPDDEAGEVGMDTDSPLVSKSGLMDREKAVVKTTWSKAAALGVENVGMLLFRNIFEIAPEAVQLFPFRDDADIYESPVLKSHASKVVIAVGTVVDGIDNLDEVTPVLQSLGLRHVGYSVVAVHYEVVGAALLKTLKAGLGDAFTVEAEASWRKLWAWIRTTMISDYYDESNAALTKEEKSLVESTWAQVVGLGKENVGVLLFKHIFEIAPEALQLFKFKDESNVFESTLLKSHSNKVIATVDVAVNSLGDLNVLVAVLRALGERHAQYGVVPAHYDVVGRALLKTLRLGLGEGFTPKVEVAWTKVFRVVSSAMIADLYQK